jgi:hypothetical protein
MIALRSDLKHLGDRGARTLQDLAHAQLQDFGLLRETLPVFVVRRVLLGETVELRRALPVVIRLSERGLAVVARGLLDREQLVESHRCRVLLAPA